MSDEWKMICEKGLDELYSLRVSRDFFRERCDRLSERVAELEGPKDVFTHTCNTVRPQMPTGVTGALPFEAFAAGFALARHETAALDLREAFEEWLER